MTKQELEVSESIYTHELVWLLRRERTYNNHGILFHSELKPPAMDFFAASCCAVRFVSCANLAASSSAEPSRSWMFCRYSPRCSRAAFVRAIASRALSPAPCTNSVCDGNHDSDSFAARLPPAPAAPDPVGPLTLRFSSLREVVARGGGSPVAALGFDGGRFGPPTGPPQTSQRRDPIEPEKQTLTDSLHLRTGVHFATAEPCPEDGPERRNRRRLDRHRLGRIKQFDPRRKVGAIQVAHSPEPHVERIEVLDEVSVPTQRKSPGRVAGGVASSGQRKKVMIQMQTWTHCNVVSNLKRVICCRSGSEKRCIAQ